MKLILIFLIAIILLKIAWHDKNTRRIPDRMLLVFGIAGIAFKCAEGNWNWGGCVAGICSISLPLLGISLWRPGSFGGGDIKLMAVSGLILGWEKNLYAFFLAMTAAGLYSICMLVAGRISRKEGIALGPFLCAGIMWEASGYLTGIRLFF